MSYVYLITNDKSLLPFGLSKLPIFFQVEDAQGQEAPVQRLADAIAGPFVYSIMTLSAATFAFWYGVCSSDLLTLDRLMKVEVLKIDGKSNILIYLFKICM